MATHAAVVTTALRAPLEVHQVPTVSPGSGEVRVRVEWTSSTPLNLHQNDGGLLVEHPQVLGDGMAGTVVEVGPDVQKLQLNDKVFGYGWREQKEKAHQIFATMPEYLLGKIPDGVTMAQAVTISDPLVTVFHTVTTDLGLPLPWPRPKDEPEHALSPILIWGGSSSVGLAAIPILKHYGYKNIIATASKPNHEVLRKLGAAEVFDYREPDVVASIKSWAKAKTDANRNGGSIPFIFDCIASVKGSIAPISKLAERGSRVAALLPVIVRDATETTAPEYSFDASSAAAWAEGVNVYGVRTHSYLDNATFKDILQPVIMPELLASGVVSPIRQRVIEGKTLLERAQKAMDAMRRKEPSGEKLVWRIAD